MFRPNPVVQRIPLGESVVCVVDDALVAPERWVEDAVAHADRFVAAPYNAYPGLELRMPNAVATCIAEFFDRHLRAHFGVRRTLRQHAKLALVTREPGTLQPFQTIPHVDMLEAQPGQSVIASVLYLFADTALGGTGFYRPHAPLERVHGLMADAGLMDADSFSAKHGIPRAYPGASNEWFQRVLAVPPRWNRMIVYPGTILHSGEIAYPERLSADPRSGRLTLNGFLTCRRQLGS